MTRKYFKTAPYTKSNIPFRMDKDVEMDVANAQTHTQEEAASLIEKYNDYS